MDNVFVPSGELSALLSQLASSRLDLKIQEGLNGCPEKFYGSIRKMTYLGLSEDKNFGRFLSIHLSEGVSVAMSGASSLDRVVSVQSGTDNIRIARIGRSLSPCGASPQGYTRPYEKDEGKHDRTGGRREDLSPSSDMSDRNQGVEGTREGLPPSSGTPAFGNGGFHG